MPRHLPKCRRRGFCAPERTITRRGLPGWLPPDLAAVVSAGGLPSLPPAAPAFSLLCCPPSPKGKDRPPAPFPSGEGGEIIVFLCKGLRPLHPQDWAGRGTGYACGKPVFSALNRELAPVGAAGIRVGKSRHPAGCLLGKVCTCRKRFSAGVPGAKPPAK